MLHVYTIFLLKPCMRHQLLKCHVNADQVISSIPGTNIGEMMDGTYKEERNINGRMLISILQVQFLGRQGLALSGHNQDKRNFIQLRSS